MTNFERITNCKSPEELAYVYQRLSQQAIYAEGRLLFESDTDDFLLWLNKESDDIDSRTIFNYELKPCPKGHKNIHLVKFDGNGMICKINEGENFNHCFYQCAECGYIKHTDYEFPKTPTGALVLWNY